MLQDGRSPKVNMDSTLELEAAPGTREVEAWISLPNSTRSGWSWHEQSWTPPGGPTNFQSFLKLGHVAGPVNPGPGRQGPQWSSQPWKLFRLIYTVPSSLFGAILPLGAEGDQSSVTSAASCYFTCPGCFAKAMEAIAH